MRIVNGIVWESPKRNEEGEDYRKMWHLNLELLPQPSRKNVKRRKREKFENFVLALRAAERDQK